jgi:DNA-binding transcriptional MerR regulator
MEADRPDKLYFKIGEVARLTSLKPSVLRFWETEFPQLKPRKSSTGQRLYSQKDLELVQLVKKLLYKDKLTIIGARKAITRSMPESIAAQDTEDELRTMLRDIKAELEVVRRTLDN